jgi:hypothetical protein
MAVVEPQRTAKPSMRKESSSSSDEEERTGYCSALLHEASIIDPTRMVELVMGSGVPALIELIQSAQKRCVKLVCFLCGLT